MLFAMSFIHFWRGQYCTGSLNIYMCAKGKDASLMLFARQCILQAFHVLSTCRSYFLAFKLVVLLFFSSNVHSFTVLKQSSCMNVSLHLHYHLTTFKLVYYMLHRGKLKSWSNLAMHVCTRLEFSGTEGKGVWCFH